MRLFHRHRWCLIDRTYVEPVRERWSSEGVGQDFCQQAFFGITTFLFQCEDPLCREVKKVECLGRRISEQGTVLIP